MEGPVLRRDLEGSIRSRLTSTAGGGARGLQRAPGMGVSFPSGLSPIGGLGECVLPSYARVFALHQNLDSVRHKSEIKMQVRPWNSRELAEHGKDICMTF